MLKNIYTTRMTGAGKLLQTRFEKINTIPKRFSRIIAFISIVVLVMSLMITSFVMANVMSETVAETHMPEIYIINNGEVIELENKPFIENGEVYVPLREFFEKIGFMENSAYINWDNGVIVMMLYDKNTMPDAFMSHTGYMYKIEIGKNELVINPTELVPNYNAKGTMSEEKMNAAPILRRDVTYVPYEYIYRIVERADNGVLSYKDKYNLEISFEGNIFTMEYPLDNFYTITQPFGKRVHPITGEEQFHNGIDFKAEEGTPVKAGIDGKITKTGFDAENGNYVIVENNIGVEILYAHLSGYVKRETPAVSAQDIVGYVGSTGKSTGAHLHMEVKINGEYVNPEAYFAETDESKLLKAVERNMPRILERNNIAEKSYEVAEININEKIAEATVVISVADKTMTILYTKVGDLWTWREAVIN